MQHFKADCGLVCFYCKLNAQDFLPFAKAHRYSFCRVADDLIDNATSVAEARIWIEKPRYFLDISYEPSQLKIVAKEYVEAQFPPDTQSALLQLPTEYLSPEPFNDLLRGFEMDLAFFKLRGGGSISPIEAESDLDLYARRPLERPQNFTRIWCPTTAVGAFQMKRDNRSFKQVAAWERHYNTLTLLEILA